MLKTYSVLNSSDIKDKNNIKIENINNDDLCYINNNLMHDNENKNCHINEFQSSIKNHNNISVLSNSICSEYCNESDNSSKTLNINIKSNITIFNLIDLI